MPWALLVQPKLVVRENAKPYTYFTNSSKEAFGGIVHTQKCALAKEGFWFCFFINRKILSNL